MANDFGMRDVIVSVFQDFSSSLYDSDRTTSQGDYSVLVAPGHDYVVTPTIDTSKYIDTCGVTEVDVARIREHLLGTDPLDFPYEFIAADANQDGEISTGEDLFLIGKAILGGSIPDPENCDTLTCDSIPAYLGWEFIPVEEYLSLDDTSLTQPEILAAGNSDTLLNLNFSPSVSFIGIKIGDVNLTCTECYTSGGSGGPGGKGFFVEPSETEQFELRFPASLSLGGIIEVPLYAADFVGEGVMGLHLWANPSYLTFEGAIPGSSLPDSQYFMYKVNGAGRLSVLWFNALEGGAAVVEDEPLAFLRMKVNSLPSDWSDVITLQNLPGRNRVYPDGSIIGHPVMLKVTVQGEGNAAGAGISLQILENPFRSELRFSATSPNEISATVELLNLNGERMMQERIKLYSGKNDVALGNAANLPSGTYLLRVIGSDGSIFAKKIIKQ